MEEAEVRRYITETFQGVDNVTHETNSFYLYNPDKKEPPDYRFQFATLVNIDIYDRYSNLDRPSVYRLNIGIGKQTFRSLFGEPVLPCDKNGVPISDQPASDFDFTRLDMVMPHPIYGRLNWVCVLSPGQDTFDRQVRPLLAEAYDLAVSKYRRLAARR